LKTLFFFIAIASAQTSRRDILRAVQDVSRFGISRCRLRFSRSLCLFARELVDLILNDDLVGTSNIDNGNSKTGYLFYY
jgi:hypothetical protein